jgi:hypothetical protein
MASQEARLTKFEADFSQQQNEITTKIDNLIKALNNQGITPSSENVRNTSGGSEVKDPSSSKHVHFVNVVTIKPPNRSSDEDDEDRVEVESDPKEEHGNDEEKRVEEVDDDYFDKFPTVEELAYHKYLLHDLRLFFIRRIPIIAHDNPRNINIPCNIGHLHVWKAYIDLNSPINIMTRT